MYSVLTTVACICFVIFFYVVFVGVLLDRLVGALMGCAGVAAFLVALACAFVVDERRVDLKTDAARDCAPLALHGSDEGFNSTYVYRCGDRRDVTRVSY